MKRWVFFVALLSFPILSPAQPPTSATAAADLFENETNCSIKGTAQSVQINSGTIDTKGREIGRHISAYCTFDRQGHNIQAIYFRFPTEGESDAAISAQADNAIYDSQGHLIENQLWNLDDFREHPLRTTFKLDGRGRVVEGRSFDVNGNLLSRTTSDFDVRGDDVQETFFSVDAKMRSVTTRQYDSSHRLVSESHRETGANWEKKYSYEGLKKTEIVSSPGGWVRYDSIYDDHGRLLSSETTLEKVPVGNAYGLCDDCGTFPGKTIYRYDANGLIAEQLSIQPGDRLVKLDRYKYDEHGSRIEGSVYELGNSGGKFVVTLDGKNVVFDWSNGLPKATYTYDERGNWIKAVVTSLANNVSAESERTTSAITYRIIKYR